MKDAHHKRALKIGEALQLKKYNTNQKIAIVAIVVVCILYILSQTVFTPINVCLRDLKDQGYSKAAREMHCIELGLAR